MARPGVDVLVTDVPNLPPTGLDGATPYFVVGLFDKGPTDRAVLVSSPAELVSVYGARTTYSPEWDDLMVYFMSGGSLAYVGRVVGPASVLATQTYLGAASAASLRADATSAGAWANGMKIEISTGTLPSTFKVKVFASTGELLEGPIDNLADPDAFVAANTSFSLIKWVKLGSAVPVVTAAGGTALAGGADDRAAVTSAIRMTAYDTLFPKDLGPGVIAAPGQAATTAVSSSTVGALLKAHAIANRRIAYLTPAVGASQATALACAATFRDAAGRAAGVFWPDIMINDGGVVRHIHCVGAVAAKRAQTHNNPQAGPAQPPAGTTYGLLDSGIVLGTSIAGVAAKVSEDNQEILNAGQVNVIRTLARGVTVYGYRSLSTNSNYRMLNVADLGNLIARDAEEIGQNLVFASIDGNGQLLSRWKSSLIGLMERYRARGQVFPQTTRTANGPVVVDRGYIVDVDNVNPPASLAQNNLVGNISYRSAPTAEHVQINISLVPVGASLT